MDKDWLKLENIKHCMTCKYYSEWTETPEDAEIETDCIPHAYCEYLHCVIDDVETCENYVLGREV